MASIIKDGNGRKRIQFTSHDGLRKQFRLGKMTLRDAELVKQKVERIIASKITGSGLDTDTARWVSNLDDTLTQKLSKAGLIDRRDSTLLKPYLDAYVESRSDVKQSTETVLGHTRRNLIAFFGENKSLRDITQGDAERFRLYLVKEGLADNTVRRRCGIAKQYFNQAVKDEIIDRNVFSGLAAAVRGNPEREHFIPTDVIEKVIESCPDAQWRLIVALSRYGGLRCPSEHLGLKWGDVLWSENKIVIRSPKTEHHEHGESRIIPLFPELRKPLGEVFEEAEQGSEFVVTRYRDSTQNLRTQFLRIIEKAGIDVWPKLFQNLRASRQTELMQDHPIHVVCAWMGNSRIVAMEHYLQVRDEDFQKAVIPKAAQNAAHHSVDSSETGGKWGEQASSKVPINQDYSTSRSSGKIK